MKLYILSVCTMDGGNGDIVQPAVYRTKEAAQQRMAEVVASTVGVDLRKKGGPQWLWDQIENYGIINTMSLYRSSDGNYVDVSDDDGWSMRCQVDEVELEEP